MPARREKPSMATHDTSGMDDALLDGSLEGAIAALRAKSIGAPELTELALGRIAAREPELNAFITVTADAARERANGTDTRSALAGAPIALKDLFDVAGVPTTGGSKLFAANVPAEDGAVACRLFDAGAVNLGKTNLHEWAFGVTNDNPHFGPAKNPWATARIPGGSSGGNGAALAARMCF